MIASLFSHIGINDNNSLSSDNNTDEEDASFETAEEFSIVVDTSPPNNTNSVNIDATYIKQGSQFYFDFDNQESNEGEQREGSIGKLPLTPETKQSVSSACSSESVSTLSANNNNDANQELPPTDLFSCYEMGELCHIFMGFGFVTSIVTLIVLVILEPFGDVYADDDETDDDDVSPQFEYNMIWYVLISIGTGVIVVCTCPFLARIAQVILVIQELVSKTILCFQRTMYICGLGNRQRNHNTCCCCCCCC